MMTFSEYLEEKKIMTAALAGIVGGVGLGLAGNEKTEVPQEPQRTEYKQPVQIPTTQQPKPQKADSFHSRLQKKHGAEYDTIMDAAVNNGISKDDKHNLAILFAIRKAENGSPGTEFGVLHPKAKGTNLRTQAGWAAATVMKNRARHGQRGEHTDFISFLGNRYAPNQAENDPKGLNANWIKNVTHHYNENISEPSN
jgi:hypothetical protein